MKCLKYATISRWKLYLLRKFNHAQASPASKGGRRWGAMISWVCFRNLCSSLFSISSKSLSKISKLLTFSITLKKSSLLRLPSQSHSYLLHLEHIHFSQAKVARHQNWLRWGDTPTGRQCIHGHLVHLHWHQPPTAIILPWGDLCQVPSELGRRRF